MKKIKIKLSAKNKHILSVIENSNYSLNRIAQFKKQYIASKVFGINVAESSCRMIIQDYKSKYHKINQDNLAVSKSIYKALRLKKFRNTSQRKFSIKNAIKQIKVLKALGKDDQYILYALNYSDAGSRCYSALKQRYKDELESLANKKSVDSPKSNYSVLVEKLKNQYKANKVKLPSETISESKSFIGLEIEFISPNGESTIKRDAERLKIKNFNIGSDGSIEVDQDECPDDIGHEVRILLENSPEYINIQLKKLCTVLSNNDAYVNQSCGLHVHLDMRHETEESKTEIGARFSRCLNVLTTLVPQSRRDNSYCKLQKSYEDRYSAINMTALKKYNTIEIRLHSGTVDFLKIKNWIALLNLIKNTKNSKNFKSLDEMIEVLKMPDDLALFYYGRYKKFNTDNRAFNNEETSLNESSILSIDQITFTENNNQSATA